MTMAVYALIDHGLEHTAKCWHGIQRLFGVKITMSDFNFTYTRHTNYYPTGGIYSDYRNVNIEASHEVVQTVTKAATVVAVELIKAVVKLAIISRRNPYALPR